jgi:hypothetical protein
MARTRAEAITEVGARAHADRYPTLDSDALGRIVDQCLRASTHALDTAYAVGDVVIPASPNGRRYRCAVAGTSDDTTAPVWPVEQGYQFLGFRIADGTTLTWEDDGPAHKEVYDLNRGTHLAWLEKAGFAASDVAVSDGDQKLSLEQVHKHCLSMAERYRPVEIW